MTATTWEGAPVAPGTLERRSALIGLARELGYDVLGSHLDRPRLRNGADYADVTWGELAAKVAAALTSAEYQDDPHLASDRVLARIEHAQALLVHAAADAVRAGLQSVAHDLDVVFGRLTAIREAVPSA